MKQFYFLLLLLFCKTTSAQQIVYQPMHGTITLWLMNHGILDGGGSPVEYQTRTIASGDTTINSETYTRLFRGPLDPAAAMNYV